MNKVVITACDNELYLIAYNWNNSYLLGNIKSGNNNKVNVEIVIEEGDYSQPQPLDGVHTNLSGIHTVCLPSGEYTVLPICINWGGPASVVGTINGTAFNATATEICEGVKISTSGANPSTPSSMTIVSGNNQIIHANVYSSVSFAKPLVVNLTDVDGKPVVSEDVKWSYVGHKGGRPQVTLPKNSLSDSEGNASVKGKVQLSTTPPYNGGGEVYIEATCGSLKQTFTLMVANSNG